MTTITTLRAGTWTIQSAHAQFAARGIMGHTVTGTIDVLAGSVEIGADHHPRHVHVTLDPRSITTGHPRRDKDLRGKRFLNVGAHPAMSVVADLISVAPQGWRGPATFHVAGAEATLLLTATLDGAPTESTAQAHGNSRLDLREAGITVPSLLVGRYVDITFSAELLRTSGEGAST